MINENALVSIIIPTYGRSEMLEKAITSVMRQSYRNIEIIIIDDNGTDTKQQRLTEDTLLKYTNQENIVYLKHEKNAGGCAARNTGIKASKGEYIGFLDDDDEWLPLFIEKHLEKMHDGADIMYCNYFITNDTTGKNRLAMVSNNKTGHVFNDLLRGWCPATTSMFIVKKECFERAGYFDESLQSFQDYDMWLTLSKEHTFECCEEYLMVKYQHDFNQLASNPIKRQHALDTLKNKWRGIVDIEEIEIFEKTIKKFQKDIYYIEFCKLRSEKKYSKSIKKIIEIIKMNNSSFKYMSKLITIFIFGEQFMHKVKIYKAHIIK